MSEHPVNTTATDLLCAGADEMLGLRASRLADALHRGMGFGADETAETRWSNQLEIAECLSLFDNARELRNEAYDRHTQSMPVVSTNECALYVEHAVRIGMERLIAQARPPRSSGLSLATLAGALDELEAILAACNCEVGP